MRANQVAYSNMLKINDAEMSFHYIFTKKMLDKRQYDVV